MRLCDAFWFADKRQRGETIMLLVNDDDKLTLFLQVRMEVCQTETLSAIMRKFTFQWLIERNFILVDTV